MPFRAAEETLSGQRNDGVKISPKPKGVDGLAPAKGILVGLTSSLLFWMVVLAAWCS